jgi:hypothetical protein
MKRNLNVALKNLNGTPVTEAVIEQLEPGKPVVQSVTTMTAAMACGDALNTLFEDERTLPGIEKHKRGKLAQRVYDAKGEIDLSTEDIAEIKKCLGKKYNPLIVCQVFDILETDPAPLDTVAE